MLASGNIFITENRYLLESLTKACKLNNDQIKVQLPIQRNLLNMLLHTVDFVFKQDAQIYLAKLYKAVLATAYYGLFRIGEIMASQHEVKAKDVHIATNKRKLLFVLRSSKTHSHANLSQTIKIISTPKHKANVTTFCPYQLLLDFLHCRKKCKSSDEQFFVFLDRTPIQPAHVRTVLNKILMVAGFDCKLYGTHSLRIGMATDMMEQGIPVEIIKKLGRWKSNCIYCYLR